MATFNRYILSSVDGVSSPTESYVSGTPSTFDLSDHSVTELYDVNSAGRGSIITTDEANRIVSQFVYDALHDTNAQLTDLHTDGSPNFLNLTLDGYLDIGVFTDGNEPARQRGRLWYSDELESLVYYNDSNDVSVNIGQEAIMRVKNNQGSTIYNGDVVYVDGSTGDNPTVKLARSDSLNTARVIGMITQSSINSGAVGYATTYGRVRGLDTSAYTAGDTLYLSPTTAGGLTTTKPSQPNKSFRVGTVIRSHGSDGSIFIDTDREIDNFTTNSVIYANGGGELAEDTNLTWDGSIFNVGGQITEAGNRVATRVWSTLQNVTEQGNSTDQQMQITGGGGTSSFTGKGL